jgi:hypothetical protein
MRTTLGRRNENDPDSNDETFLRYLNDFINQTMSNDVRLFEQYGTLIFTIDETNTTGVYTFNDVGATDEFMNISQEAFVTLTDPPAGSISWNRLYIYQDPGVFYQTWGVNNEDILIPGYPTEMLYYGNELVFRTIPDTSYDIYIYGYKIQPRFSSDGDPEIPYDYWMRYLSYGAAYNYALDYRLSDNDINRIHSTYARERALLLTKTHNQIKHQRAFPRF